MDVSVIIFNILDIRAFLQWCIESNNGDGHRYTKSQPKHDFAIF